MTTWIEGKHGFLLGAQAQLIEEGREIASSWATPYVVHNPAHRYVIGRFVEADRANNNRQKFTLEGLQMGRPTITHAPMNMNHAPKHVVGAYIATELIYPTDEVAAAVGEPCPTCGTPIASGHEVCMNCIAALEKAAISLNPYIESLAVLWKHYFPEEHAVIEAAHAEGRLYFSMECVPQEIQCTGEGGCGAQFAYDGRKSTTYCSHLQETSSDKLLIKPHFTAGAILVPPVRPGWSHADVHSLVAAYGDQAEELYEDIKADLSHLSSQEWEGLMVELLTLAK